MNELLMEGRNGRKEKDLVLGDSNLAGNICFKNGT
jgi:hypothetical protein